MQIQNESQVHINPTDTLPVELSITFNPERISQLTNDAEYVSEYQLVAGDNMTITKDNNRLVFSSKDTQVGERGPQGPAGPIPNHQWIGTQLQIELPSGGWGVPTELVGAAGLVGADGVDGSTYVPVASQVTSDTFTLSWLSADKNAPEVRPTTLRMPYGPAGQSASVDVGRTYTLPPTSAATVTNVGTQSNAIFEFGIPQGIAGSGGIGGVDYSSVEQDTGVKGLDGTPVYQITLVVSDWDGTVSIPHGISDINNVYTATAMVVEGV